MDDKGNGKSKLFCDRCGGTGKYVARRIDEITKQPCDKEVECECGARR